MRVERTPEAITVETDTYRLSVEQEHPVAHISHGGAHAPMRLMLLAALDSDRGLDGTLAVGTPTVEEDAAATEITLETASTTWDAKRVRLRCTPDAILFDAAVEGRGRLTEVRVLGGWYSGNPRWGGGMFHSAWGAHTLFDPSPDDPKRILQPAAEPATTGVIGSALPGRGHWFFTPAPLLFAGTAAECTDPGDPSAVPWQTLELECDVASATFTELRYAPFLGGFSLVLAYDAQTSVDGRFATPALALRFGVADPYAAIADHGERLRRDGLAPRVERRPRDWWSRPIFCGWGEQCREVRRAGGHAADHSRRGNYDNWLGLLHERGIVPGTVVIDDKWQTTYGRNEVDPERWPDLGGWIADRHAAGQRVLVWFKAWDAEGLPDEACVTDRLGHRVAADPDSDAYRSILGDALTTMLGGDGLAADGLKVDFTAQTPAGPGLEHVGEAWGVALLHRLLRLVYGFAKEANPDALVVTHTPSPLFADVTDMIRLNDLLRLDDLDPWAPAVAQMRHRARIAAAVDPGLLVDTDDWCLPSKAEWRAYLDAKPDLGVPALYYATGIDHSGEAFTDDDYAAIRSAWTRWEARRMRKGTE